MPSTFLWLCPTGTTATPVCHMTLCFRDNSNSTADHWLKLAPMKHMGKTLREKEDKPQTIRYFLSFYFITLFKVSTYFPKICDTTSKH